MNIPDKMVASLTAFYKKARWSAYVRSEVITFLREAAKRWVKAKSRCRRFLQKPLSCYLYLHLTYLRHPLTKTSTSRSLLIKLDVAELGFKVCYTGDIKYKHR